MPSLTLVPRSVLMQMGVGDAGASLSSILNKDDLDKTSFENSFENILQYMVRQEGFLERCRLTSGHKFLDILGSVSLRAMPTVNIDQPVGSLVFIPEFQSDDGVFGNEVTYSIDCEIPQSMYDELLSAGRLGRMPKSISIEVFGPGVKFGWEPDGSGLDWDNEEQPRVLISKIDFVLNYVSYVSAEEDDCYDEVISNPEPPTRAQLDALLKKTDDLQKHLRWIVSIGVFFLVITILSQIFK